MFRTRVKYSRISTGSDFVQNTCLNKIYIYRLVQKNQNNLILFLSTTLRFNMNNHDSVTVFTKAFRTLCSKNYSVKR